MNIMKICILTPRFPIPECGGDLLRINNIARHLKSQGHELILVSYTDQEYDLKTAAALYDKIYTTPFSRVSAVICSALFAMKRLPIQCGFYYSQSFNRLFGRVIATEKPDIYISHLLRMVPFLENYGVQDKSIIEMTDALSKTYSLSSKGKGSWIRRNVYKIEKRLIGGYEKYVVERYQKVVLVSSADIDFLKSTHHINGTSLVLHSNGVECTEHLSHDYAPDKICFIGHMQSLQNQDAAINFVENIFPLILKKKHDAKFYIVGAHPPKRIQRLANGKNIFVTGFVDDINTFIADASVAVAPVRIAAGIQNKVLVAMGCSIPVVLTPLIAQSIPELKDGENCYITGEKEIFADRCLSLMTNPTLRRQMALNGNAIVRAHYSWNQKLHGYLQFPTSINKQKE